MTLEEYRAHDAVDLAARVAASEVSPAGVQVAAVLGGEDRLFALAGAVERARPRAPAGGGAAFHGKPGMASGGHPRPESRP